MIVVAVAVAVVTVALALRPHSSQRPTYAQLVAQNYRVLSRAQSRELVAYARRAYACLREHAVSISSPVVTRTRITMRAPGRSALALVRAFTPCERSVGPPPKGASLQARAGRMLVYAPKQCLLDPREVDASGVV